MVIKDANCSSGGPDASVTFSNLSYCTYDVYVYFAGLFGNSGNVGTVSLNGSINVAVTSLAFTHGPYDEATGGGNSGHYVRFAGVTGSSFTVGLDAGGSGTHMGLFGLQIVQTAAAVPAPAALPAGLAMGSLALARRRRRR